MKITDGMTKMIGMPHIEAYNVIDAIESAEKAGDLAALKWCARRIVWLYEQGESYSSDMYGYDEKLFNNTYADILKRDPPPESIAAFINRENKPEPPTAAAAEKALDTVQAFFEENIPRKVIAAALSFVDAMRDAIKTATEAGEK
jgi:hypothetical protein